MEIVIFFAVGALVVAAARKFGSQSSQTKEPPKTPEQPPSSIQKPSTERNLDPSVEGGILTMMAGSGLIGATYGAEAGSFIDRQLGGIQGELRGTVATVTGAVVGGSFAVAATGAVAIALTGVTAGLVFTATIIAGVVCAAALVVGILVYVIVVIAGDAQRAAEGQQGALATYWAHWEQMYTLFLSKINALGNVPMDDDAKNLFTIAMVDEYMQEANRQAFRAWMNREKGFGLSWLNHAQWGRDRGYFVGQVGKSLPLVDTRDNIVLLGTVADNSLIKYNSANYVVGIPPKRGDTVQRVAEAPADFKAFMEVQGRKAATLAAYLNGLQNSPNVASDEAHFAYWQKQLGFLGSHAGGQKLSYEGKVYDWRDLKAQKELPA